MNKIIAAFAALTAGLETASMVYREMSQLPDRHAEMAASQPKGPLGFSVQPSTTIH